MHFRSIAVAPLSFLLTACATSPFGPVPASDVVLASADGRIELALDAAGQVVEVEYQCRPEDVPQLAMRAVEAVLPGGQIVGCEKEYHGREVLYEVAKLVDGRRVEIIVTPDGQIRGREIEVPASSVPDAVLENAAKAAPGGNRILVEELRDGSNVLVGYHVKSTHAGIVYKCVLTPSGKVERLLRKTPAEIELPLPLPR